MKREIVLLAGVGIGLMALPSEMLAAKVTDSLHFDGSYAPDSVAPPMENDTWNVFRGANLDIVPDSPFAGAADFNDTNSSARIAMTHTYSDAGFNAAPAGYEWEYAFKLKLVNTPVSGFMPFGVRGEGVANGKCVALMFNTSGQLCFAAADYNSAKFSDLGGSGKNYNDGVMHTFTVRKVIEVGSTNVLTYVDGALVDTRAYAAFDDDAFNSTEGFGIWSSTPGTCRMLVDDVRFAGEITEVMADNPIVYWRLNEAAGTANISVSDYMQFDGTYEPNSNEPPAGNSKWTVFQSGALDIVPNSPFAGAADFNDTNSSARIAMTRTYADAGFNAAPAGYVWEYTFRLELEDTPGGGGFMPFGVRSEGNGNGKAVALMFNTSGQLCFANADFNAAKFSNLGGSGKNYNDEVMHTFTVRKVIEIGLTNIMTYVDGALVDTRAYSTFDNDASTEGFGIWSSTPGTCRMIVDDVRFSGTQLALDSSSSEWHGSLIGGVISGVDGPGEDPSNLAADFDGINDYLKGNTLGSLGSSISNGVTLEFWIRTSSTAQSSVMGLIDNIGAETALQVDLNVNGNFLPAPGTTVIFVRGNSGTKDLTAEISANIYDGEWHHVACVIIDPANNDLAAYVDGVEVPLTKVRTASPDVFDDFDMPFIVGGRNLRGTINNYSAVTLDEVAIYDYALSAERIEAHYRAIIPPSRFLGTIIVVR